MVKPIITEKFADNGEHSHWELINPNTGDVLWSEEKFNPSDYVCTAGVCPCLDDPCCEGCSLKRLKKVDEIIEVAKRQLPEIKIGANKRIIEVSTFEGLSPIIVTEEFRKNLKFVNIPIVNYSITFKVKGIWEVENIVRKE